jgi:peptidoglycan hydrolase-like protein with peptidoglycan-binding domain
MQNQLNLIEERFEAYEEPYDTAGEFSPPLTEVWQEEVSRRSQTYIRWVQQSLNKILGLRLIVDGRLGPPTCSAIRSFQRRRGLAPDGIVGPQTERALLAAGAGPPPGTVAPSQPSAVPLAAPAGTLIKREATPPAYTLYVDIPLGGEAPAKPMTGIFVPAHYRPLSRVDLILYLHGFKNHPGLLIDAYWDAQRFPYWPLREGVNASRKNVILVAPTLGPRSQTGSLTRPGGFDAYLSRVLAALRQSGPYARVQQPPVVGNVILACHSGGGWPMRQLAVGNDRYAAQIRECWGFDSTYNRGDDTVWAQWARSHPDARLYIYYMANSQTQPLSLSLKRQNVPNVFVEWSTARGHDWVPIAHWQNRLQGAQFLASS